MQRAALKSDKCPVACKGWRVAFVVTVIAVAFPAIAPAQADDAIQLPSGRLVTFHDVIETDEASRYRFLEPDLSMVLDVIAYEVLEADMRFLCESFALDRIEGGMPTQIFISIADRPVEFGVQDPDATQVFEAYRPEDGACIWEEF